MENVNTNLEEIFNALFPTSDLNFDSFCIDARKLHQILGAKRNLSNWFHTKVAKLKLKENIDFVRVDKSLVDIDERNGLSMKSTTYEGAKVAIDYSLTLDTAKHMAMTENSETGYQIRSYFIQAEKALRTLEPELTEEIQQKVLGYNRFLDSSSTYSMAEAAQLLGTGRTRLMKDLRSNRYLKPNNTPYQKTVESGYMTTKLVPTRVGVSRVSGRDCSQRSGVITVARVTAKGLAHLRQKL